MAVESFNMRRKVAITGATGMIGSHLAAELVRAGYDDIALPVRNRGRFENLHRTFACLGMEIPENTFTLTELQFTDTEALAAAFREVDTVFHCAAVIMTGELDEQGLVENNVAVARSVADAAIAAGVRRIIHTSSIVVLRPEGNGQTITEENMPHVSDESSPYQRSKYYSDLEMERVRATGIELITLYPAVVIGEGDWSLNGSSAMVPIIAGGLPVYVDGVMAYADVRDVARAYVTVANNPAAAGERFIISGANLSYRDLLTLGARAVGRPKPFIRVGKGLVYTAYGVIRGLTALRLMKNRSIKKSNLNSVLYGNSYSGDKITRMCGFTYTPMEQTVNRVVKKYLADKKQHKRK